MRDRHGPVFPPRRQSGRVEQYAVNVEPIHLVEVREFTERAVDVVDRLGPVLGLYVDLDRRA